MKPGDTPCERPGCGHGARNHRLDDSRNIGPTDPHAEFRCLGPVDVDEDGTGWPLPPCPVACPDYIGEIAFPWDREPAVPR